MEHCVELSLRLLRIGHGILLTHSSGHRLVQLRVLLLVHRLLLLLLLLVDLLLLLLLLPLLLLLKGSGILEAGLLLVDVERIGMAELLRLRLLRLALHGLL